jgi:hypothetical protein
MLSRVDHRENVQISALYSEKPLEFVAVFIRLTFSDSSWNFTLK